MRGDLSHGIVVKKCADYFCKKHSNPECSIHCNSDIFWPSSYCNYLLWTFPACCLYCSIEYWPDPQRGITEAYRVLKKGGKACLIGPVHPTFWLSRFFADVWMLFPTEEEYIEWFTKAGFSDVKIKRIGPSWYRGVRRHGLIMGCSVTGVKPESGESPLRVSLLLLLAYAIWLYPSSW